MQKQGMQMATNSNYQIVLDFLVNLKSDKSQLEKISKEAESILSKISPDLNLDSKEIKQAIESLSEMMKDMNVDIDTDEAKAAIAGIENALASVDAGGLSEVEKALADIDEAFADMDAEAFQKEVERLAGSFDAVRKETERVLSVQKTALQAMKSSGKEGSDAYGKLEREIAKAEEQLEAMNSSVKQSVEIMADSTRGAETFVDSFAKFQAIGMLGEQFQSIAAGGIAVRDALLNMQAKTGATAEEMARLEDAARAAFRSGVGESVADAINAMASGQQMLGEFLDADQIETFVTRAGAIAQVFDKDINEVIGGSRTFIAQFGLEGAEAADLISLAMQKSGSKMDDTLDTLDEYSQLTKKAGYSAEEFVGILTVGMEKGSRDTDKLADAIKETQIRLNAGDTQTALASITSPITAQIQEIVKLGEQGSLSIKEVMQQSAEAIKNAENSGLITASLRDQLSTALSGTMAEDIGGELYTEIFSTPINPEVIRQNALKAGQQVSAALGPVNWFESIQRQLKGLYSDFSSSVGNVLSPIGGAMASVSQVAPALSLLKGFSLSETVGDIKKMTSGVGDFAKNLLTKMVPATATATAGQNALNASILANPYVIAAAAIAGLVVGLHYLSDALHESAVEKLEDAKADQSALGAKIETVQKQKELIQSNADLVSSFKSQGEAAMNNSDLMVRLASTYPGVIDSSKSYTDNLKALEQASGKSASELGKLDDELFDLSKKQLELQVKIAKLNVDKAKGDIEDSLTDVLSGFSWENVAAGAGVGAAAGTAFGGPIGTAVGAIAGAVTGAFGNQISEFMFGTSTARQTSEALIKGYTDAIYKAKDDKEVEKASLDFQMAVWNDPSFAELSDTDKQQIRDKIVAMGEEKKKAIDIENRNIESDISNFLNLGRSEGDIVNYISKQYGLSKDKAKELVETQKQSKKKQEEVSAEVKKTALAFGEVQKAAQEKFNKALQDSLDLMLRIKEAKAKGEDTKGLVAQLNAKRAEAKETDKQLDSLAKIQELEAKRYENKEARSAFELAKEQADLAVKNLELAKEEYEFSVLGSALSEQRKKDDWDELLIQKNRLDAIEKEKRATIEAFEAKKLISYDSKGEIVFSTKLTQPQDFEIRKTLQDLSASIQDQKGAIQDIQLKINADTLDVQDKLNEVNKKRIEWEISVGLRDEMSLEDEIEPFEKNLAVLEENLNSNAAKYIELQKQMQIELSKLPADAAKEQEKAIKDRYQIQLNAVDLEYADLQDKVLANERQIFETQKKYYDRLIEENKAKFDKLIAGEQKSYEASLDLAQKSLDAFAKAVESSANKQKDSKTEAIEKQKESEIAKIEEYAEMQAISEEESERRKAAIEEKYQKKREDAEKKAAAAIKTSQLLLQGQLIAAEKQKNVKMAELTEARIKEEIKLLDEKKAKGLFTSEDRVEYEALKKQFDDAETIIKEDGDMLKMSMSVLGDSLGEAMGALFAGDSEAAGEKLKSFFVTMSGIMIKGLTEYLNKVILQKVLETLGVSGDGIASVLLAPVIYATVSGLLNALAQPLLQPLSYSTGGRIDDPTLAVVGDASRLGGRNREWIFNDSQLVATVQMANVGSGAAMIAKLDRLERLLASQSLSATLKGSDIELSLKRTSIKNQSRAR